MVYQLHHPKSMNSLWKQRIPWVHQGQTSKQKGHGTYGLCICMALYGYVPYQQRLNTQPLQLACTHEYGHLSKLLHPVHIDGIEFCQFCTTDAFPINMVTTFWYPVSVDPVALGHFNIVRDCKT